jgi:hypothetical protein
MGADLNDLTPATKKALQRLADEAGVDIGINATSNGNHKDPGHAAGTAVDIGYVNNRDIGSGPTNNPQAWFDAFRVQKTAARLGGLTDRGNLGPAGKYNGTDGPRPIVDPALRAQHQNHIHLSYVQPPAP